jgi:hypothetical protein
MSWTKLSACLELSDGDGLVHLVHHVDLAHKVLAPLAGPHDLSHVGSGHRLVKALPESFSTMLFDES